MLLILELCICKNEDGPKNEDPPLKKKQETRPTTGAEGNSFLQVLNKFYIPSIRLQVSGNKYQIAGIS